MNKNPIIIRKPIVLRYTKNGAFDIPTFTASVAIDYFSGEISINEAKTNLIIGGHIIGCEDNIDIINELQYQLKNNERFFEYIEEV